MVLNLTKYQYVIIFIIRKDLNFMKKRIKMLSAIMAILTILCIVGSFSTFALIDYTEEWYMNGSLMYGYSKLVDSGITAGTYCANRSYEKRVKVSYDPYYPDGSEEPPSTDSGYIKNNSMIYSIPQIGSGTFGREVLAVHGTHWVKAATHMYWCSADCEDNTYILRDLLD